MTDTEFKEMCFVFFACVDVASEVSLVLELYEDTAELTKARSILCNLYNKYTEGMSTSFKNNREVLNEKLKKDMFKFAKQNIK